MTARSEWDALTVVPAGFDSWGETVSDGADIGMTTGLFSGHWYRHPLATGTGNHAPSINTMFAIPLWLPKGTRTVQFGELCVTGVASAIRRGGLYVDNGAGYPGALEREFGGTLDVSSSGFKTWTAYTAFDWPGLLWYASVSQVAAATVLGITNSLPFISIGTGGMGSSNQAVGYSATGVSGALPDPFPSTVVPGNGCGLPAFKLE